MRTESMLALIIACTTAAIGQPRESSPTLEATTRGRAIVAASVDAIGGAEALRNVRDMVIDATIRRTAPGQGLRPSQPGVTSGWRSTVFDFARQRVNELRVLDITGNQLWDIQLLLTPQTGYSLYWPNNTMRAIPAASLPRERAVVTRRHLLPLLISMTQRPEALRSLGSATIGGRLQDSVSFTDVDGALITLLVDSVTHLPTAIEQLADDPTIGDTVNRTSFSDYRRVGAFSLPYRIVELRAPNERVEYAVQHLQLDTNPADTLFEPPSGLAPPAPPPGDVVTLAPDVYLVPNSYESVFVVFDDYVLVLEGGGSTSATESTIARIKQTAPGKPIRYVVATHFHNDHLAGLRSFMAAGATIVTTLDARAPIEAIARSEHRINPDSLSRSPRAPVIETVERERVFSDARHEVHLYQIGPSPHVDQILIAHLPKERILFEADLLDMPNGQPSAAGDDTADLAAKLEQLGLSVDRIVPVHGVPGTPADLEKSLRRGRNRALCPPGQSRRVPCAIDGAPAAVVF